MLTAIATYIALASSWLLAIPARRAALLQGNITAIEAVLSEEPHLRQAQEQVIQQFRQRAAQSAGRDRRLVRRGIALLVLSFLTFTAAVVVQASTDAAFRQQSPARGGP